MQRYTVALQQIRFIIATTHKEKEMLEKQMIEAK